MKTNVICNFAVVRFLPYPETEEFVNVGIVLACPQLGLFDYRFETRRRDRVTRFFPEMDPALFIEGRHAFLEELLRVKTGLAAERQDQRQLDFAAKAFLDTFRYLVKPRESLFRFGGIGTVMTDQPHQELERLFAYYVQRQFAATEEFREALMTRQLTRIFRASDILRYYHERRFGDDLYHVVIPFVHDAGAQAAKAIKALDLEKSDTTRIIEYGDRWRMRIRRLRDLHDFPQKMLFVVRQHARGRKHDAAREVCRELEQLNVQTVPDVDSDAVIEFARAV